MPLVEIIPGLATDSETVDDMVGFAESIRKVPIVVKECAGFLVNRVLMAYLNEAVLCLQEGAATCKEIEQDMIAFGMPVGPFTLLDTVGLDISYDVARILYESYGPRMAPAPLLGELVKAGRLGVKNGHGFYEYDGPDTGILERLIEKVRPGATSPQPTWRPSRLLLAMVNEAVMALQEGIASARDIDVAMVAGTGFPTEKEGPLHYADRLGIDVVLHELEEYAQTLDPRFWPAPLLRRMVSAGFTGTHAGRGFFSYEIAAQAAGGNLMTAVTSPLLSCSVDNAIATLTLNHPPVNALTPELLAELENSFDSLAKNSSVKVVIVTGTGRFFIAGADIQVLAGIPSSREAREMALRGQAIFMKIELFEKPVIAALNGTCIGGGLELAMCCHIRIAAEGARLGQPEVNLGIIPGFGGTQRLSRLVGRSKALELILTGDLLSASEAKALGLISQVSPPEELLRAAHGLGRKIASKGQLAVRAALRAVTQGGELTLQEGLRQEAQLFADLCDSDDKREGVQAFLEKRQPQFKDR